MNNNEVCQLFFLQKVSPRSASNQKMSPGYPASFGVWGIPPEWDSIDATFYLPTDRTYYYFKGDKFSKSNQDSFWKVPPGNPKNIDFWGQVFKFKMQKLCNEWWEKIDFANVNSVISCAHIHTVFLIPQNQCYPGTSCIN